MFRRGTSIHGVTIVATKLLTLTLTLTLAPAVALTLAPARAGAATADWTERLDRGEVLVYSTTIKGQQEPQWIMKAVVDAPPARIWALLADCAGYRRIMPRIKAARKERQTARSDVCTVTVDMPFPYSDMTSTGLSTYHRQGKGVLIRRWRQLRGDYKLNRGEWRLAPFKGDPNRTLVTYRVIAVPKAWVPDWIRRLAQKRSLPETVRMLRREAVARR
jgi:hypothetical protein